MSTNSFIDRPQDQLVRGCLIVAVVAHVTAAWFSAGFYHPDEHFHVLEFLNARLGWSDPAELPWEWPNQMRPGALVLYAWLIAKPMIAAGLYDPNWLAFLLRLSAALLGLLASWQILLTTSKDLPGQPAVQPMPLQALWLAALFVIPLVHARYSVDSISGSILFIGACFLVADRKLYLAGLLLCMASVLRPHFAPMVIAILLWWQYQDRSRYKVWYKLAVGAGAACLLEYLSARWLYGDWVFTPLAYFEANVLSGRVDDFGVMPWWGYFTLAVEDIPALFGALFILAFVSFVVRFPRHWLSWGLIAVLAAHFLVGHKNIRFLFPLVNVLPLALLALYRPGALKWHKIGLAVSSVLLVVVIFRPMDHSANFASFVNDLGVGPVSIVTLDKDPYESVGLRMNFYDRRDAEVILATGKEINAMRDFLFFNRRYHLPVELQGAGCELLYSSLADWLGAFNINGWLDRSEVWRLYRCSN